MVGDTASRNADHAANGVAVSISIGCSEGISSGFSEAFALKGDSSKAFANEVESESPLTEVRG